MELSFGITQEQINNCKTSIDGHEISACDLTLVITSRNRLRRKQFVETSHDEFLLVLLRISGFYCDGIYPMSTNP